LRLLLKLTYSKSVCIIEQSIWLIYNIICENHSNIEMILKEIPEIKERIKELILKENTDDRILIVCIWVMITIICNGIASNYFTVKTEDGKSNPGDNDDDVEKILKEVN